MHRRWTCVSFCVKLTVFCTDCRWAEFQFPRFGWAEPPPGQDNLIKLIAEAKMGLLGRS